MNNYSEEKIAKALEIANKGEDLAPGSGSFKKIERLGSLPVSINAKYDMMQKTENGEAVPNKSKNGKFKMIPNATTTVEHDGNKIFLFRSNLPLELTDSSTPPSSVELKGYGLATASIDIKAGGEIICPKDEAMFILLDY